MVLSDVTKIFCLIMIAYDKHECTIHFYCIQEINFNDISIDHKCTIMSEMTFIQMYNYDRTDFKHITSWF